jgi:RHS repeat-associated protein
MILKTISDGTNSDTEKYILDITGKYPVVLLVIDTGDSSITNEYFYADKDLLAQQTSGEKYFYLKDRLGSVRAMIDDTGSIVNNYTYTPFGDSFAESETINNRFKFASYNFDVATELYYLNARWYDPVLMRFTSRDPVRGSFKEPLTLHAYLYCLNNPINMVDPDGEFGMWMRAKEASVKVGAKAWAFSKIHKGATFANAMISGTLNVVTGPQDVDAAKLFAIGAIAGAVEMRVGLGSSAWLGSLAGSSIQNAGNQLLTEDKSLGWAALSIAASTGLGGASDWFGDSRAWELGMIGVDVDLGMLIGQGGLSWDRLMKLLGQGE